MVQPIGVLGGIFDPVHSGHLSAAQLAAEHFNCIKILFVPSGVPPHKLNSVTASARDRLAMLELALAGNDRAEIWKNELLRGGISYTIDTLEELATVYPGVPIHFIIGADNLHEIHTWHRYREILGKVVLCVTERPGYSMDIPETLGGATIRTFPSPQWGLSSSELRLLLARGYSGKYLLPESVHEYIMKTGLYRRANEADSTGDRIVRTL